MKKVNQLDLEKAETININATQKEIAKLMKEKNTRHVFLLQKGRVKGIISGTDLINALAEEILDSGDKIMSKNLISVKPEDSAGQALRQMLKSNQYSLPVIKNERLHGILTLTTCLGGLNDT